MTQMMRDMVEVQGGFKPSVQLPRDCFDEESNRHFIETYIPTEEILDIFMRVRDSLHRFRKSCKIIHWHVRHRKIRSHADDCKMR